jgi:hypothetical protein
MSRALILLLSVAAFSPPLQAADPKPAAPRYTFSWPITGDAALQPRGGSTQGAEVALNTAASSAWTALQQPGLSNLERDRRAVLAMAGTYRVTFDFLEIVPFGNNSKPARPYQSWGTEKVYVDEDRGNFISLVHILQMQIKQADGTISEPMVTKHWRQDWRFEPDTIVEYAGRERWQRRDVAKRERTGRWLQTVYQVDESPRYASIGRWEHSGSFSTWVSGDTWRPLPRREWSVRDDYQVLIGTNRHTIDATGWVQEENNLKGVLDANRQLDARQPYLAREYGVARYSLLKDLPFAEADLYYTRTRSFWSEVRVAWSNRFAKPAPVTLRGAVDKYGYFMPLFAQADELAQGKDVAAKNAQVIRDALQAMGAL